MQIQLLCLHVAADDDSVTKPELILHKSRVLGSSYTLSLWKSSDTIVDDF
jgi:hypothetical protein